MHIKRMIATVVILVAGLGASVSAWADLVLNGGFEAPVVTDPLGYEHRPNGTLDDWFVSSPGSHQGIVQFNDDYRPVGDEDQSIQIEFPGDYIEQSITTIAGQTYSLSFLLSAYDVNGGTLSVKIGSLSPLPFSGVSTIYESHTVPFTAGAGTSTLLHFENAGALFTYPHLDNISVTAVPEPASLALVGFALAGLGIARRRKSA